MRWLFILFAVLGCALSFFNARSQLRNASDFQSGAESLTQFLQEMGKDPRMGAAATARPDAGAWTRAMERGADALPSYRLRAWTLIIASIVAFAYILLLVFVPDTAPRSGGIAIGVMALLMGLAGSGLAAFLFLVPAVLMFFGLGLGRAQKHPS